MNVMERVCNVLAEALVADISEITPEASLRDDLGAESIDFLDITFRLEREFDIKISESELFPHSVFRDDNDAMENGVITHYGLTKLKEVIPHGDFSKLNEQPKLSDVPGIFTVATLVKFIESKLKVA